MIIIPVKEGENIERALGRFKRKFDRTGRMREIRSRQAYVEAVGFAPRRDKPREVHSATADGRISSVPGWFTFIVRPGSERAG